MEGVQKAAFAGGTLLPKGISKETLKGGEQMADPATQRELLRQLDEQGITDYRRYSSVRKFLDFKARKKNIPITGSFELTPLCNLDCKMC